MLNMIDDESTDDELGVNLQLTQRLQINKRPEQNGMRHPKKGTKEFKQFYNERKKGMYDDDLISVNISSSPELPRRGEWFVPDTPSPYHLGNKKRQNGDRVSGQGAKSKRTCLSNTFCEDFVDDEKTRCQCSIRENLPLYTVQKKDSEATQRTASEKKKKIIPGTGTDEYFQNFRSNQQCSSKDISPDETYENHLANKMPLYETGKHKLVDTGNKMEFNQYKKNDYAKAINVSPSLPSTSKVKQMDLVSFAEPNRSKPFHRGVQFIDSDSNDENTCLKRGALKGGKQANYGLYRSKKGAHKVLDTDDSDDSNWVFSYRNSHSGFSPSDSSSGSNEVMKPLLLKASTSSAYDNNLCSSAEQSKQSSSSNSTDSLTSLARNISFSRAGSNSSENEDQYNDDACFAGSTKKSKNIYKQNRKKLPLHGIPENNLTHQSNENSLQSTSRSRLRKRQKSPQRCIPSHSRFLRSKKNQNDQPCASPTSSEKISSDEQRDLKLATRFPDIFDAEEGLEFFTANSYSTSDSSNESSVAWDIISTTPVRKHRSGATLEHVNVGDSSENEVSVIFSTNSPDADEHSRRTPRRGSAKNKRYASEHELSSALVSLSPDPVEQVRQMEEDERLARHLQAQFDAEANGVEEPNARENLLPVSSDESETIDPVGGVNFIHDILNLRHNVLETNHNVSRPSGRFSRGRRRGSSRGGSRHATHVPEILNVRNVPGVTVLAEDPWTWQFARMLGLGTTLSSIDPELDEYEVLFEIAEDIGEVVPRGLHKTEVNRLPTRQYMNPNANNDTIKGLDEVAHKRTDLNKECQVCLCDYEYGDVLRILPCFHEFHIPCIDPWLKINRTCPVCRVVVNFNE